MSHAKKSPKRRRLKKTVPVLGAAAGLSLALASEATAATPAPPSSLRHGVNQELILGEEEISDISLSTFYIFDKDGSVPRHRGIQVAGCGGCGCRGCGGGCRCGGGCGGGWRGCGGCGGGCGCGGWRGCGGCGGGGCGWYFHEGFGACVACAGCAPAWGVVPPPPPPPPLPPPPMYAYPPPPPVRPHLPRLPPPHKDELLETPAIKAAPPPISDSEISAPRPTVVTPPPIAPSQLAPPPSPPPPVVVPTRPAGPPAAQKAIPD